MSESYEWSDRELRTVYTMMARGMGEQHTLQEYTDD